MLYLSTPHTMDKKTKNSRKMTKKFQKFILLMGILFFLILPQQVAGGTTGTAIITANVIQITHAQYTANRTVGTAPLVVKFLDVSTGMPTAWDWSFGDNTGSTDQSPVHEYRYPGIYTVRLNVTDTTGHITSASGTIIVNTPAPAQDVPVTAAPADVTLGGGSDDFPGTGGAKRSTGSSDPAAGNKATGQQAPPTASSVTRVQGNGSLTNNTLNANFPTMPDVAVSWTTQINDPAPGAWITTEIHQTAEQATLDRFKTALHLVGQDIGSLAYIMVIRKSGIPSTGPASISMDAPPSWVNRNGGTDAIVIVRVAGDGTTEVLSTKYDGHNINSGNLRFIAESQHGLSIFGLIGVIAYTPEPGFSQPAMEQTPAATPTTPVNLPVVLVMIAAGIVISMFAIVGIFRKFSFRQDK